MHYVDHNSDPTFEVLRGILHERPSLGEMVKTAQVGEEAGEGLPRTAFADPDGRRFPVHTAEDTLLSMAYATKQASVPDVVLDRIKAALDVFNIDLPDVTREKKASADTTVYLLPETQQFPIKTASDVPKADDALVRNHKKLRPDTLARAAVTLVKEAASRDLDVSLKVLAWSGLASCDIDKTAQWVAARGEAAPAGKTHFDAFAANLTKQTHQGTSRTDLVKVAAALGELDALYGLDKHYGKTLPTPQETVFNSKEAMERSLDLAGKPVTLSSLLRIDPASYGDVLGRDIVAEITEDGELVPERVLEIFATLPRDMQQQLVSKLSL